MKARLSLVLAVLVGASLLLAPPAFALPKGTKVETYKGGLNFPIDMSWVKGTRRIFFTEKNTGNIRIMRGRRLLPEPCAHLGVNPDGESGLLGIVLHPNFKQNHWLYVYWTDRSPEKNRVTRFEVIDNHCENKTTIIRGLTWGGGYHNGGQLEFMNGKLFVSVGEAHSPNAAQDTGNRIGKILRLNPDGTIPADNPFGNAVWSYGHRNPFGLAHRPGTNRLYETENGPSCDDELNIIKRGRNYGWGGGYSCGTAGVGSDPKGPVRRYSNIIVPTDLWWYRGRIDALNNHLLMGDFSGNLHAFTFKNNGNTLKNERIIYSTDGITDVSTGPGRWAYFLTTSGMFRIVKK